MGIINNLMGIMIDIMIRDKDKRDKDKRDKDKRDKDKRERIRVML